MIKIILFSSILMFIGCASRQKILDVPAVSMKVSSLQGNQKLKAIGDVKGQYCASASDKGSVGLMDEAIRDAEKKSGGEVFTDASFFSSGSCIELEATANKIQ